MEKNSFAVQETKKTPIRSLDWEDPLEEDMASHSSFLAWTIPWTEEPGGLPSMELQSRTRLRRLSTCTQTYPLYILSILISYQ